LHDKYIHSVFPLQQIRKSYFLKKNSLSLFFGQAGFFEKFQKRENYEEFAKIGNHSTGKRMSVS
jgi:hypothetical protein